MAIAKTPYSASTHRESAALRVPYWARLGFVAPGNGAATGSGFIFGLRGLSLRPMSHGPNRYRAERRLAEAAAKRAGRSALADARSQRVVEAWNARARRGKPAMFFPTFETALAADCSRLTFCCPACKQIGTVDLWAHANAHHPRAPISVLIPKLSCERCCPNPPLAVLIELGEAGALLPTLDREQDAIQNRRDPRDEPAPPVPTMQDLPEQGVTKMSVWCGRWPHSCSYHATVAVSDIDLTQTIVQFAANLECPDCGKIGGQAMPRWPNSGGGPGGAHNH